tara:strand:+ start:6851 stop:8101 length:1251 start_codon:yes stop_codon:yes gene_type:complete
MPANLVSKVDKLLRRYGFFLVILYCIGALSPAFYPKSSLLSNDLDSIISAKSGSAIFKQTFWLGLFVYYVFNVITSKELRFFSRSINITLLLLILICITISTSALWSAFPSLTIKRSIFQFAFCGTVFFSIYYAFQQGTLGKCVIFSVYAIYALTFLSIIMGYGFSVNGTLASFAKNKNQFAASLIIIIVFMITLKNCNLVVLSNYKLHISLLVTLVFLTQSKTNLAIITLFYLSTKIPIQLNRYLLSVTYIAFIFLFCMFYPSNSYFGYNYTILDIIDEDFLTGRGYIWDLLYYDLHFFNQSLIGYGYGAYFGTPTIPYFFDDPYSFTRFITSAHNGYIDHIMQLGIVLTSFLAVLYFIMASRLKHRFLLASMSIPIIHNITETSMLKDSSIIWLAFLFSVSLSCLLDIKILNEK